MYVLYCNIPFLVSLFQSEKAEHILHRALERKEILAKISSKELFPVL